MTETESKSGIAYLKGSDDVDDSYGNSNKIKDGQDVNLNLKNSIHDNLYITIPDGVDGFNYAQYIISDPNEIPKSTPIRKYKSSMTLVEKMNLLYEMKDSIRTNIIKNLKKGNRSEFYDANSKEEIKPFVAYWKMIKPLEKPTTITLPSSLITSWIKEVKITATIKDGTDVVIKGALLRSDFDGNQTKTSDEKGKCTFTVPAGKKPGDKTYTVKYDGKVGEYLASEAQIKITFAKDTPTLTPKTGTKIYAGYKAQYQLKNSSGTAIPNAQVKIKIGNGNWTNYTTNSNGIVSITISKAATVYYKFEETTYYNSVREQSQTFTIKPNEKKSKCSGTLTQSPTSRTPPYQTWSDLYSDCTASNYQRCGRDTSSDSDVKTLGSAKGSFHQPAKLMKKNWDLGVPNNAVIKSVHVIWSEKQTNGPSVSTAKSAFIKIKKVTLKTSGAITYEKTINTNSGGPSDGGSWVLHDLSLGTSFNPKKKLTLTLAYGPNTSTNTGTIYLKGPKVIVEYVPAQS